MATYWENSCSFGLRNVFLWYQYLIVSLVFSHLGFWRGNLSLIAPFPDLCLLVPLCFACAFVVALIRNVMSNSIFDCRKITKLHRLDTSNVKQFEPTNGLQYMYFMDVPTVFGSAITSRFLLFIFTRNS